MLWSEAGKRINPDKHRLIGNKNRMAIDKSKPIVVCAADENYVKCLAVTAVSLLANCSRPQDLTLVILDGGISDLSRKRLCQSLEDFGAEIKWVIPNLPNVGYFPTSGHISAVSYFRIFLGELLPDSVLKLIYLDSDLVVDGDILDLWKIPFDGSVCIAAQDLSAPYIDSQLAAKNYPQYWRLLAATRPIPNYEVLGLQADAEYFNAGVISIDLETWRNDNLQQQLLTCFACNDAHMLWWDQYLLNVVLQGRWKKLDPRWNQTPGIYNYANWNHSPFDKETFENAIATPYIRHYASHVKPWHFGYMGPGRKDFFNYLDLTDWSGWRPSFDAVQLKKCFAYKFRDRLKLLKHQFEALSAVGAHSTKC